jgi:hypothetical protein
MIDQTDREMFRIKPIVRKEFLENIDKVLTYKFLAFQSIDDVICKKLKSNQTRIPCRLFYVINQCTKYNEFIQKYFVNIPSITDSLATIYESFISGKIANGALPKILINDSNDHMRRWSNSLCSYHYEPDGQIPEEKWNYVIFDRHGEGMEGPFGSEQNPYYQIYGGGSSFHTFMKDVPDDDYMKNFVLLELLEAALTKVVIIDERISSNAEEVTNGYIKNQIFKKMGIYIIPQVKENITINELQKRMETERIPIESVSFLVLHQGIIDKSENSQEQWEKYITRLPFAFKIIDSGRGKPANLIEGVRFVQLSAVSRMLDDFDKFSLVQTLYSLRR